MADKVQEYENAMKDYVGSKYSVFVSSGSTANTILAMYLKDKFYTKDKNVVIFPSTTWITSVSPFIREGFEPKFIDIGFNDLSLDLNILATYLKENKDKVACVFITSLLGFVPDIDRIKKIEAEFGVKIMLDNCENTLGQYNHKNVSSYFTSTTSTYFGHQLQSVEGGFIFTNDKTEYEYFLMARNHGMVRSLKENKETYQNPDVDSRFDFNILGNNFRNTNINAFIGLLDLKRKEFYKDKRVELYKYFYESITNTNVMLWNVRTGGSFTSQEDVPFCIPLYFRFKEHYKAAQKYCLDNNIEFRPIISGNLLRQTCLKQYYSKDFVNSELLHNQGFYVGLHSKVKERDLLKFATFLNEIQLKSLTR